MFEQGTLTPTGPALASAEQAGQTIRIVIADDHPVFRDGLARLLEMEEGLEVVARVSDGAQVPDTVAALRPDILLLDLKMPQVDGLTVLRTLRERGLLTRVIVLTASEYRDQLAHAMQLGASGIVLKQDVTDLLIKSIRRVHAGEIWLHSSTTAAVMQRAEAPPENEWNTRRRMGTLLTRKEREVVLLVAQGLRNKEIATRLFISEQTVKNHLRSVFEKLQVGDRLEVALYAIHHMMAEA
jgi:DNA-binding NarL/FixJ family response regulator